MNSTNVAFTPLHAGSGKSLELIVKGIVVGSSWTPIGSHAWHQNAYVAIGYHSDGNSFENISLKRVSVRLSSGSATVNKNDVGKTVKVFSKLKNPVNAYTNEGGGVSWLESSPESEDAGVDSDVRKVELVLFRADYFDFRRKLSPEIARIMTDSPKVKGRALQWIDMGELTDPVIMVQGAMGDLMLVDLDDPNTPIPFDEIAQLGGIAGVKMWEINDPYSESVALVSVLGGRTEEIESGRGTIKTYYLTRKLEGARLTYVWKEIPSVH